MGRIEAHEPETWSRKRLVTLDIDWAPDEAVEFCLDLVLQTGAFTTVFLTHDAPWLEPVRAAGNFEWGIHPNFERAVHGNGDASSGLEAVQQILGEFAEWAPPTQLIRPHGLMTAGRWLPLYRDFGYTHLSSVYPRLQHVAPYEEYNGIVQVPIHWSDTGHLYLAGNEALGVDALDSRMAEDVFTVLLFHPIHVFLNTDSITHYEEARRATEQCSKSLRTMRSSRGSIYPAFLSALEWASP